MLPGLARISLYSILHAILSLAFLLLQIPRAEPALVDSLLCFGHEAYFAGTAPTFPLGYSGSASSVSTLLLGSRREGGVLSSTWITVAAEGEGEAGGGGA